MSIKLMQLVNGAIAKTNDLRLVAESNKKAIEALTKKVDILQLPAGTGNVVDTAEKILDVAAMVKEAIAECNIENMVSNALNELTKPAETKSKAKARAKVDA